MFPDYSVINGKSITLRYLENSSDTSKQSKAFLNNSWVKGKNKNILEVILSWIKTKVQFLYKLVKCKKSSLRGKLIALQHLY